MRIRYLKNTEEILQASPFVIQDATALRGKWLSEFVQESAAKSSANGTKPLLCLEIGCGKGQFIREMARRHPGDLWVGDERVSTILARAVGRLDPEIDHNVSLICTNALELDNVFAPGEIDCLYLNFSDPWPKDKHAKRRLTSDRFLPIYGRLLSPTGFMQFKTDNDALFAYSLESLQKAGWQIVQQSDDLHHSPYAEGNIMTEYEENFTKLGKNIHYLRALPPQLEER